VIWTTPGGWLEASVELGYVALDADLTESSSALGVPVTSTRSLDLGGFTLGASLAVRF